MNNIEIDFIVAIWWTVWHARNKFIFELRKLDPEFSVAKAKAIMDVYQTLKLQNLEEHRSTEDPEMQRGSHPRETS